MRSFGTIPQAVASSISTQSPPRSVCPRADSTHGSVCIDTTTDSTSKGDGCADSMSTCIKGGSTKARPRRLGGSRSSLYRRSPESLRTNFPRDAVQRFILAHAIQTNVSQRAIPRKSHSKLYNTGCWHNCEDIDSCKYSNATRCTMHCFFLDFCRRKSHAWCWLDITHIPEFRRIHVCS